ncbi:hypothetical protein scyTo_0003543 [Scyliorhinus torazame]|uniref:Uncharacterized protein n=1 Tax=Scyliorhinus torazame TaxID=75743 RepID=A0A401PMX7_SCYTO|nr:hypothetical protein [Scyliorhinus torazame]
MVETVAEAEGKECPHGTGPPADRWAPIAGRATQQNHARNKMMLFDAFTALSGQKSIKPKFIQYICINGSSSNISLASWDLTQENGLSPKKQC